MSDNAIIRQDEFDSTLSTLTNGRDTEGILSLEARCQAVKNLLKKEKAELELQNRAAIAKLKCKRANGRILREDATNGTRFSHDGLVSTKMVLTDYGLNRNYASRAQQIETIPDTMFAAWCDEKIKAGYEITESGVLSYARDYIRKQRGNIPDPDEGDDLPQEIQQGDIVQVGRHTLICGDNREQWIIDALIKIAPFYQLAFCDPPYNADVAEYDSHDFTWQHDYFVDHADIVAVTPGIGNLQRFMQETEMPYQWSLACHITNGMTRGAVGFGNWIYTALFSTGSLYRNAQDATDITISGKQAKGGEKRQKPLAYLHWLFGLFCLQGAIILDPFAGSGASIIAAEKSNMTCVAIEKDEKTFHKMVSYVRKNIS